MDKVAGNYNIPLSVYQSSAHSGALPVNERSSFVRGHHSSINKAVEAHRMMVEERHMRKGRRDFEPMSASSAQQPTDLVVAQQVTDESGAVESADAYENTLIEPATSQSRPSMIQSFQSQEPDRPMLGEPVPKGSYLDVEA